MLAFVRMLMQIGFARLVTVGWIAQLVDIADQAGVSREAIIDGLTVFVLGLLVAIPKVIERTRIGATLVEWWNLLISWGQTRSGPQYLPKAVDPPSRYRVRV